MARVRPKATPKDIAYRNEYNRQHFDKIQFFAPKGKRAIYKAVAAKSGMQLGPYFIGLIERELKKEGENNGGS